MKRKVRSVGGVVLAGVMVLFGVGPASAAEAIDGEHSVSLTIHKLEHPGGDLEPGTGAQATLPDSTPLPGVGCNVTPVLYDGAEINVAEPAGWSTAAGLIEKFNAGGLTTDQLEKGSAISVVTDADGSVSVPGVGQGLYLVEETGATDDFDSGKLLGKAAPFLVMLPFLQENQTQLYDVHVYPKNTVVDGSKTVKEDNATGLGTKSTTWRVEANIPLNTSTLRQITITDPLPEGLQFVPNSIHMGVSDAEGQPVSGITNSGVFEDGKVTAVFGEEDRAQFNGASGGKAWLEFDTTTIDIGNGTIVNDAEIIHRTPDVSVTTDVSDEVYWGAIEIFKHVEGNSSQGLQGAQFQVFTSEADALARINPVFVLVNGEMKSTFTSGEDGKVAILGLNAKKMDGTDYWVVETQAPSGYQALTQPKKVTVTPRAVAQPIRVEVPNSPVTLKLPGLGSTGMIAVYAIGAALLIAGVASFLLSRKAQTK